ncbi:MAG: acyl carrier protein [Kineosporiaceae bacterium]
MVDKEELRATIADTLDVDAAQLTDDAHFMDDLGIDSLMALEVMVVLERQYGVKLDESRLKEITCLNRAHDLLHAELAQASS